MDETFSPRFVAFKVFDSDICNTDISDELMTCQNSMDQWGRANGMPFGCAKENLHIVSRTRPCGEGFKILGAPFACKSVMADAVAECVQECGWRVPAFVAWAQISYSAGDYNVVQRTRVILNRVSYVLILTRFYFCSRSLGPRATRFLAACWGDRT